LAARSTRARSSRPTYAGVSRRRAPRQSAPRRRARTDSSPTVQRGSNAARRPPARGTTGTTMMRALVRTSVGLIAVGLLTSGVLAGGCAGQIATEEGMGPAPGAGPGSAASSGTPGGRGGAGSGGPASGTPGASAQPGVSGGARGRDDRPRISCTAAAAACSRAWRTRCRW
jgi:hypothetical protein